MSTGEGSLNEFCSKGNRVRRGNLVGWCLSSLLVAGQTTGCAHYPANRRDERLHFSLGITSVPGFHEDVSSFIPE
jgi:hypothetical protein